MIARRWHGRVPAAKAEAYLELMAEVGLPDYRSTEGNRGAWCLHRAWRRFLAQPHPFLMR